MKRNFVSIGIVILILFLFNITQARVWYVHPDSIQNCIQDCLNECTYGDTVLVGPGTYIENIVWPNTQRICLMSELGPELTIIDGNNAGSVISCSTSTDTMTIIKGFTIQNGYAQYGGGIYCDYCDLKIADNIIRDNRAASGGAIFFGCSCHPPCSCSLVISGNTITENTASSDWDGGGGIFSLHGNLKIVDNIIRNNRAQTGGGISNEHSQLFISGNTITENTASGVSGAGGGINRGYMSNAIIHNNIITYNTATSLGGGISGNRAGGGSDIRYNTINHNTAARGGGISDAIYASHNIINYNTAEIGGGIELIGGWEPHEEYEISNNTINYNTAQIFGGGIAVRFGWDYVTIRIVNHNISYNTAPIGAGIYHYGPTFLTIDSCTISNNDGDGITCDSIANDSNSVEIHNSNIFDNSDYGIHNLDSIWINAEYNWWGDNSGPFHDSLNPEGLGNMVSDYVDFIPWLQIPGGEVHDVGVLEILEPLDTILDGSMVTPTAVVKNFGDFNECFWVFFTIGCVYYDFQFIRLESGAIDTVKFKPWVSVSGYYKEAAATRLDVDENPDNDIVTEWLLVMSSFADAARGNKIPIKFDLFKPYPNPTLNNLTINYALPLLGPVELMIYDVNGQVVKELISEIKAPGYYRVNTDCQELSSGAYIVKMKAGNFETRKKFIVTR